MLILFTLCYTAYPQIVTFDRYSCVESLYFCPVVPCISHTDFAILSGVLRRKAIINNSRHRYHASCQRIHTLSYNQLEDTELKISWHCTICNNPNYSSTVHDYQTVDVSVDVTNDSSIPSIPPHSPDNRPLPQPMHSATPTRNEGPTKIASPLKVLNINFQSIKSKLCRLSNVIHSVKPDVIIETWLIADIKDPDICPDGYRP